MLQEILDTQCPHCQCTDVKSRTQSNKHVNGHWNETLKFECGHELSFSPNFMKTHVSSNCMRTGAHHAQRDAINQLRHEVKNYASKRAVQLDVSANAATKLQREILDCYLPVEVDKLKEIQ